MNKMLKYIIPIVSIGILFIMISIFINNKNSSSKNYETTTSNMKTATLSNIRNTSLNGQLITNLTSNNDDSTDNDSTDENKDTSKKIFLGDSRTVAMKQYVCSANTIWSCEVSKGLDWLKSTGVPNIEKQITSNTSIIILMGINDLYNVNDYIEYINKKSEEWAKKGAKTFFVSVNPINEATYSGFKNSKIEEFNATIQSGLNNVYYIDTYSYFSSNAPDFTSDGLHYNSSTSKKIYELVIEECNNPNKDFESKIITPNPINSKIAENNSEENDTDSNTAKNNSENTTPSDEQVATGSSNETSSSDEYIWPVPSSKKITSSFGPRTAPTAGASSFHKGIDIGLANGSAVVATKAGTVEKSQYGNAEGYFIMINHGNNIYSYYKHNSKLLVNVGDTVSAGQTIAYGGSTGISTGPHLHFAIKVNDTYVNPLNYVKK